MPESRLEAAPTRKVHRRSPSLGSSSAHFPVTGGLPLLRESAGVGASVPERAVCRTSLCKRRSLLLAAFFLLAAVAVVSIAAKEHRFQLVLAQELVEVRPVAVGEPRRLRHVALGHLQQAQQVVPLEAIARFKRPHVVVFTDALPRGPEGAVDRDAVKAKWGGDR